MRDDLLERIHDLYYYQRALGYQREIDRITEEIEVYEAVYGELAKDYNLTYLRMMPEEKEKNKEHFDMWWKKFQKLPNLRFSIGHEYIMQPPSQKSMQVEVR